MIHIHPTYWIAFQSSALHNQPMEKFQLLKGLLIKCTISSFLVTLQPRKKAKVIENGIKM